MVVVADSLWGWLVSWALFLFRPADNGLHWGHLKHFLHVLFQELKLKCIRV